MYKYEFKLYSMKLLDKRVERSTSLFAIGIFLLLLPIYGLLSGTAISVGLYGSNYQEIRIDADVHRYWFIIYIELFVSLSMVVLSYIHFPLYEHYYLKLINYRDNNKTLFVLLMFVLVPIVVTFLIVLIMYALDT